MNEKFNLEDSVNTLSSVFFSSEQQNLSWDMWAVQPEDEISLADSSDGIVNHIREEVQLKDHYVLTWYLSDSAVYGAPSSWTALFTVFELLPLPGPSV